MNQSKKPLKTPQTAWWRSWGVAIALSVLMGLAVSAGSLFLLYRVVESATNTLFLSGTNAVTAIGQIGQGILLAWHESIEHVLMEGADEDRVAVLNQIASIDFTEVEEFPARFYCAIECNLCHENDQVRIAAQTVMEQLLQSPFLKK